MGNREKIINTALSLFSKYGYENVGIQWLVDEVGVKKPTLYHYFGNKQGLMEEIFKIYTDDLIDKLKNSMEKPDDIVYTLESITRIFFGFAKKNSDFYKFYFTAQYSAEESELRKSFTAYNNRIYGFIKDYFIMISHNRDNLKDKINQLSLSFLGTINTYTYLYCYQDYELNEQWVYLVVKQFMYGIFSL